MSKFMFLAVTAVIAGLPAAGISRQPLFPVKRNEIQRIQPSAYATTDAAGNRNSDWMPVLAQPELVPNWSVMFDSMNTNPATQVSYDDFYGNDNGPTRFANEYRSYVWVNDTVLPAAQLGRAGKLVRVGLVWNPNGGSVRSGTKTCAIKVNFVGDVSASDNGPATMGSLSGIQMVRTNLAAGIYEIELDMSTLTAALPAPGTNSGGIRVEVGSLDGSGDFVPLVFPNSVQPLLSPMIAPGDPQFPGTNPSQSGAYLWADDETVTDTLFGQNRPNYVLEDLTMTGGTSIPFAERYNYDYTLDTAGILQPATSVFTDLNGKRIAGTITFSGLANPASLAGKVATIEVRNSTGTTVIASYTAALGANGAYSLPDPAPSAGGSYRLYIHEGTWLGKLSQSFSTTANLVTTVNFALINGDVDMDNEVGPSDFSLLSSSFGLVEGDPGFLASADLDQDGEVGPNDFSILSSSFGETGD